ncbi:MAG: AI-2E family transporter [Bacillota bacterium]
MKVRWRWLCLAGGLLLAFYFFYIIRGIVFPFVLAASIAYILEPLVTWLERRRTPTGTAIGIVYAGVFIVLTGVLSCGLPKLVRQLDLLVQNIPVYTAEVQMLVSKVWMQYHLLGLPSDIEVLIEERIHWVEASLLQSIREALELMVGATRYAFSAVLAPIIAFYFLKDRSLFADHLNLILPRKRHPEVWRFLHAVDGILKRYFRGYLVVALVVGGLTGAVFAAFGLQYSVALGLFAATAELIPYFGSLIGAVPAVALALLESHWLALKVMLAVVVVHQFEASFLSPRILGGSVGLHPLTIIAVVLLGGHFFGLAGMFLAVPVAAIISTVLREAFKAWRLVPPTAERNER